MIASGCGSKRDRTDLEAEYGKNSLASLGWLLYVVCLREHFQKHDDASKCSK